MPVNYGRREDISHLRCVRLGLVMVIGHQNLFCGGKVNSS